MSLSLKDLKEENLKLKNELTKLREQQTFYQHSPQKTEGWKQLKKKYTPFFVENAEKTILKPAEPTTTMIVGDNLPVLAGLNYVYTGRVDVIYIDPPYNTGKTIYSYSDQRKTTPNDSHSGWLSFMAPRLKLAKPLLTQTGVIFVAVGVSEQAHLKLLMDQIFGEQNYISTVTVEGVLKNNARLISQNNEYWLVYAKDAKALKNFNLKWRVRKPSAQTLLTKANQFWNETLNDHEATLLLRKYYQTNEAKKIFDTEPGLKMYNKIDVNGRVYRAGDLSSPGKAGKRYTVFNPDGQPVRTPARGWVHSETTLNEMISQNVILWNGVNIPTYKRYLDENTEIVLSDLIKKDENVPAKILQKMLGHNNFTFPKNPYVIAEWLDYVLPDFRKKDKINPPVVMDFFAGSGSTAHAVALLNSKDNGNRQCVLVTENENNIPDEVTYPRLKAMFTGDWATGRTKKLPGQLVWLETQYHKREDKVKNMWSITGYSTEYVDFVERVSEEILN